MIDLNLLPAIGFSKIDQLLPDWYYVFDARRENIPVTTFVYESRTMVLEVYFSPRGVFGKIMEESEFTCPPTYVRLVCDEDLLATMLWHLGLNESEKFNLQQKFTVYKSGSDAQKCIHITQDK